MTSPHDLSNRLKFLSEAHRDTIRLIHRLSDYASPQATSGLSSPHPEDDSDARTELAADIHQSLKEQEEDLELLKQEVEDVTSVDTAWSGTTPRRRDSERTRERSGLVTQADRLGEDLRIARIHFRQAQLRAKRAVEASKVREKEEYLESRRAETEARRSRKSGGDSPTSASPATPTSTTSPTTAHQPPPYTYRRPHGKQTQATPSTKEDLELAASQDLTTSLRRIHQSLTAELSRSQFAHDTLNESTAAISSLNESYSSLDTLLSSSRNLVSTLLRSQKSDTWYLETAFYILVATIGWLFFRRILYGPGWWFLYLPTKWAYSLVRLFVNVSFGALAGLLGAVSSASGGAGSGNKAALESVSSKVSTSLVVKPSATGRGAPRFGAGMAAPSIAVGAGGQGAKSEREGEGTKESGSLLDKVKDMIDESRQTGDEAGDSKDSLKGGAEQGGEIPGEETVLRERRPDEKPNPKKKFQDPPPIEPPRDEL
ncbi:hypothetical protein MMC25_000160 [Agyrium rufum]|nr:hypothetical protein [Agyrium rufum]